MEVLRFRRREEKNTAANKPGLSQLMAIVGAYIGPLAVTDHLRLFLFPFSFQYNLRKADIFHSMQELAHFSSCSSIQTKAIKIGKDRQEAVWQDRKNESTSAPEMAQFYFLRTMLP